MSTAAYGDKSYLCQQDRDSSGCGERFRGVSKQLLRRGLPPDGTLNSVQQLLLHHRIYFRVKTPTRPKAQPIHPIVTL